MGYLTKRTLGSRDWSPCLTESEYMPWLCTAGLNLAPGIPNFTVIIQYGYEYHKEAWRCLIQLKTAQSFHLIRKQFLLNEQPH